MYHYGSRERERERERGREGEREGEREKVRNDEGEKDKEVEVLRMLVIAFDEGISPKDVCVCVCLCVSLLSRVYVFMLRFTYIRFGASFPAAYSKYSPRTFGEEHNQPIFLYFFFLFLFVSSHSVIISAER